MSSSRVSDTRICPQCGARNSGLGSFCAECGAALTDDAIWSREADDPQRTASFAPVEDPQATQEIPPQATARQETPVAPAWATPATSGTWPADPDHPGVPAVSAAGSRRGFVLGVIASIIIVLVIGFVIWSSLLSDATRETIAGWFGWLG